MDARRSRDHGLIVKAVGDREVTMTRAFAAPRALVFAAWTKPDQVSRWYGVGNGWSMPLCQIDLRVGGAWRYLLQGPGGMKMGVKGVYREITAPDGLICTESYDDGEGGPLQGRLTMFEGESLNTLTLVERDGLTTLVQRIRYPNPKDRDYVLSTGMEHGAALSFDGLEDMLSGGQR